MLSKIIVPLVSFSFFPKFMRRVCLKFFQINQIFSKRQCGFRQGHNTHHNLFLMVEKLKKILDNSGVGRMLLTDLSKAFDCLRHDLLVAKLSAYGFDQPSFCFIFGYHSDRTQRTKANNAYSSYTNIK